MILQLLTSHPNPTPAGVRFVSIGLCMLIACPSLVSPPENERKSIEWVSSCYIYQIFSQTRDIKHFIHFYLLMPYHMRDPDNSYRLKVEQHEGILMRFSDIFKNRLFVKSVIITHHLLLSIDFKIFMTTLGSGF